MDDSANPRRAWGETPWQRVTLDPPGPRPARPEVVIIGGGLTGVSAAYHLARRGLRPVLLEANRIGAGASGRTGGIVLEGIATGPREGARDCVPRLAHLVEELGIDCDLRLPGCHEIQHRAPKGAATLPWHDAGAPISIYRTVPGGSVEPGALMGGLAQAAVAAGALLYEHTPVQTISLGPSPEIKVKHENIASRFIVVAVNAWTLAMLPGLPPIRSALTYACITEPLSDAALTAIGLEQRIPFYTADTPYLWGRLCADGSIVFGAGLTFGAPDELERISVDGGAPAATLDTLETRIRALNPELARVRFTSRWGGPIAFRDGALPILCRHPQNPQVLIAGAYAGHGVAFSVHAGAMMAAAIADNSALPAWGSL